MVWPVAGVKGLLEIFNLGIEPFGGLVLKLVKNDWAFGFGHGQGWEKVAFMSLLRISDQVKVKLFL